MKPLTDVFISGRISWFSVSLHAGSEAEFDPVDHMVLVTFVQFDEIAAPAPDAHDQVAVPLGMHLGVEQLFAADGIELQLVAAQGDVGLDEHSQFADALLVVENRLVELEGQRPTVDHTITAVPLELRGGYTGYWRAADVLEFTSHGYDGYVFDENNNRIDFKGYRADCINQFALDYLDQYAGEKPFFMTVSQIEPHHQNDHNHYEGPNGSKQRFADFVLPEDLKALGGNAAEEYPDYLGQCASLDENLGKLVSKLKEKGLYDNTVILYASDHGSHFKTRNRDAHLNGYDDYKRSCHDGCLHVPLVICGGPFKGGKEITDLVSTESIPKTLLALAGVDVGDKMIGENLLDVVEKKNHNRVNEVYAQISESRCGRCIRTADYMYSVYAPGVNGGEAAASDVYADDFLYDMQKDPWQLNNVVADPAYAAVKAELRERLLNWIQHAEGSRPTITD